MKHLKKFAYLTLVTLCFGLHTNVQAQLTCFEPNKLNKRMTPFSREDSFLKMYSETKAVAYIENYINCCLTELGFSYNDVVDLRSEKADIQGFTLKVEVSKPRSAEVKEKYYLKGRNFENTTRVIRNGDVEIKSVVHKTLEKKLDRTENIMLDKPLITAKFNLKGFVDFYVAVSSPMNIYLTKPNGEIVRTIKENKLSKLGKNRVEYNLFGLQPGIYYLRFEDDFGITEQKIAKEE